MKRMNTIVLTVLLASMPLGLSGCQGGGGGGLAGLMGQPTAMSLLSPMIKDAANGYIGNLTSLTSSLNGLKSWQDAVKLVEEAMPKVKALKSDYDTLAAVSGDDRMNLLKAFGPKIDAANSGFLGQSTRLRGDGLMSKAIAPVLDQVKLFK